jgi:hypothetical protein
MVDRGMKEEKKETKKPVWEVPMEGSHIGKRKKLKSKKKLKQKTKKLKTKKLRNSEDCCTKEERTEGEEKAEQNGTKRTGDM